VSPRIPIAAPWGARRLSHAEERIREIQKRGPGPWVFVGTYPADDFTTYWSPPWQNSFSFVAGFEVAFRLGVEGRLQFKGKFDATNAEPGTVALTLPTDWRGETIEQPVAIHLGLGEYVVGRMSVNGTTGEVVLRWHGRGFFEMKVFADRDALDGSLPDEAIIVSTGNGKFVIFIAEDLDGTELVHAAAGVSVAGAVTVQIRNITQSNLDLLSTRITIDSGEYTSYTAATPPVIIANQPVATGDRIAVDVDAADGTAEGLAVILRFAARDT